MFQNYLKIAWRNLRKNKATSFINVAGLATGMAVAMMIGLWMHDELSFNKYHKNYDRLAQVYMHQNFNEHTGSGPTMSLPTAEALKTDFGSDFKYVARTFWNEPHLLTYGEKKLLGNANYVDADLPRMLSLELVEGNYETALREPNSVLLSQSVAKALFGEENPMGKTLRADQTTDVEVTGIYKDLPANSGFRQEFFLPWAILAARDWVRDAQERWEWDNHFLQVFVQLEEQANLAAVSAKIKDVEKKNRKDVERENPQMFLHPMSDWHLFSKFEEGKNVGGGIQYVRLFGAIGAFVLLLACINFMNLSTARSEKRAKEVGIRKSVGSLRGQLVWQFLSESLLVASLALVFSIALVQLALPWFNQLADKHISLPLDQPVFWAALLGFVLVTGLLAGSYPAFYLSSFQPLKVLKGTYSPFRGAGGWAGRWASAPRKALVVVQFTVSVSLIIGTLVVFNQIQHARNRPVGYDREGLLKMTMTDALYGHFYALRNDLLASGAVAEASQSSSPVTDIWANSTHFEWEGKAPGSEPLFGFIGCTEEFGKTIGWQIVEGRDFSRKFSTDTAAFILNEAAVKLTGLQNIVGKTIRREGKNYTVVGVVKDMVMQSPYMPAFPTIFTVDHAHIIHVKLMPAMPVQDALAQVEAVFKKHDPASPFDYKFADDEYEAKFRAEERVGKLARVFAILAVFISCLGLFGLSAFVAEQRTKEIGIRKVLGATVANLWAMQSRGFVGLVIVSCAIAAPLAWYFLDRWLADYEYRISLRWEVFALSGLLAVAVTLATVSFQSVKAALANPVKSLRSE